MIAQLSHGAEKADIIIAFEIGEFLGLNQYLCNMPHKARINRTDSLL